MPHRKTNLSLVAPLKGYKLIWIDQEYRVSLTVFISLCLVVAVDVGCGGLQAVYIAGKRQ